MTNRNDTGFSNRFPMCRITHVVERFSLTITGALSGLFVVAHLAKANVDVFDSIGLVFAMLRFGIIGFHLGNGVTPLSREAGIGPSPKADVVELHNAAGAFLATVAAQIALANKIARMVWSMMARGERYKELSGPSLSDGRRA
jgi:hypothetical protein